MKNQSLFQVPTRFFNTTTAKVFAAFALLVAFSLPLQAQSPKISIQGTLKAANGTSVDDGQYDVTFKFYTVATGGTAIWEETATVEVVGSIYSHLLGSVTALDPADFAQPVFLGVTVNNFELTPRTELSYSPYAFSVAFAQEVVCSGAVGDVKYSILNPTQFAAENGDCWVPMDGRNIAGSALASRTGSNTIPDASGVFFRAQEFSGGANRDPNRTSGSTIAQVQQDEFESHNHGVTDPGHSHPFQDSRRNTEEVAAAQSCCNNIGGTGNEDSADNTSSSTTGITIDNRGGSETRPVNMNLYVYIRIN